MDHYDHAGRLLDEPDYDLPHDPDADPVVGPSDPRFASLRGRIEACERLLADELRWLRAYLAGALHDRPDCLATVEANHVAAVERAANTLSVYSGLYGWLKAADLYGADRCEALVAHEVARARAVAGG